MSSDGCRDAREGGRPCWSIGEWLESGKVELSRSGGQQSLMSSMDKVSSAVELVLKDPLDIRVHIDMPMPTAVVWCRWLNNSLRLLRRKAARGAVKRAGAVVLNEQTR